MFCPEKQQGLSIPLYFYMQLQPSLARVHKADRQTQSPHNQEICTDKEKHRTTIVFYYVLTVILLFVLRLSYCGTNVGLSLP